MLIHNIAYVYKHFYFLDVLIVFFSEFGLGLDKCLIITLIVFCLFQSHSEMQQRYDKEKRDLELSFQRSNNQLETKLKETENLNKVGNIVSFVIRN